MSATKKKTKSTIRGASCSLFIAPYFSVVRSWTWVVIIPNWFFGLQRPDHNDVLSLCFRFEKKLCQTGQIFFGQITLPLFRAYRTSNENDDFDARRRRRAPPPLIRRMGRGRAPHPRVSALLLAPISQLACCQAPRLNDSPPSPPHRPSPRL